VRVHVPPISEGSATGMTTVTRGTSDGYNRNDQMYSVEKFSFLVSDGQDGMIADTIFTSAASDQLHHLHDFLKNRCMEHIIPSIHRAKPLKVYRNPHKETSHPQTSPKDVNVFP
jgi:hypothetical protein